MAFPDRKGVLIEMDLQLLFIAGTFLVAFLNLIIVMIEKIKK